VNDSLHLPGIARMPPANHAWLALSGSIVLGACAQIALKYGANNRQPGTGPWRAAISPWLLIWAASFAAATVLWIMALSHLDISYAYPLLGLGYVLVTALAALLLGERVSPLHWLAVLLIAAGAACVARSV
jgi:undecaprenyl phosphate-alpha-L-ara4N flippase subunit ArnE